LQSAIDQRDYLFEQRSKVIESENNKDAILAQNPTSLADIKARIAKARELASDAQKTMVEIKERSVVFDVKVLGSSENETPILNNSQYVYKITGPVSINGCHVVQSISATEVLQKCEINTLKSLTASNVNSVINQCQIPERNEDINFCIANVYSGTQNQE
jgi:hypothetical protein